MSPRPPEISRCPRLGCAKGIDEIVDVGRRGGGRVWTEVGACTAHAEEIRSNPDGWRLVARGRGVVLLRNGEADPE